jgi:Holliday junction resolvasome RuvABC endonuclease subunit
LKKIGLDASTTTVGFAFVDNKNIVNIGFIPIDKQKTIRDKVQITMEELTKLDPFDEVDKIYIEDNLSGFSRGRTSQQTIIKLAKFNAVLTYCLEFAYGEIVEGVNPMYNLEEYIKLTKTGLWDKRNMDAYDALVCALYE